MLAPTVVREDLAIDLPDGRDQLTTRSSESFGELRARVYAQIQHARSPGGAPTTPATPPDPVTDERAAPSERVVTG